jgi:hypothetical protein
MRRSAGFSRVKRGGLWVLMRALLVLGALLALGACDPTHALDERACRVQMHDSNRSVDSLLQSKEIQARVFLVTDRLTSIEPATVEVSVSAEEILESSVDGGIPRITVEELQQRYVMKDDQQVAFTPVSGYSCTAFERSLIYFLIVEWFYYG